MKMLSFQMLSACFLGLEDHTPGTENQTEDMMENEKETGMNQDPYVTQSKIQVLLNPALVSCLRARCLADVSKQWKVNLCSSPYIIF